MQGWRHHSAAPVCQHNSGGCHHSHHPGGGPAKQQQSTTATTNVGAAGANASGVIAPYADQSVCASAVGSAGSGQVVSCGLLFADEGTNLNITAQNSTQVS